MRLQPKTLRDALIVELIAQAGLRTTEAASLQWEKVSLEESFVQAGEGKRERKAGLSRKLAKKLEEYVKAAGRQSHVFHCNGKPLSARQVQKIVKRETGKTGNRLRAQFARRFLEKSNDLLALARAMGNTTPNSVIPYLKK